MKSIRWFCLLSHFYEFNRFGRFFVLLKEPLFIGTFLSHFSPHSRSHWSVFVCVCMCVCLSACQRVCEIVRVCVCMLQMTRGKGVKSILLMIYLFFITFFIPTRMVGHLRNNFALFSKLLLFCFALLLLLLLLLLL